MKKKKLTKKEKNQLKDAAIEFMQTMRGQLILGQALYIAMAELKKAKYPEVSNIADMKFFMDNLFPLYAELNAPEIIAAQKKLLLQHEAKIAAEIADQVPVKHYDHLDAQTHY